MEIHSLEEKPIPPLAKSFLTLDNHEFPMNQLQEEWNLLVFLRHLN